MNIEDRNIRFTSTVICRIFLGICCCFLAACSSQSSQNNSNIFLYAVDFSHSTLSPGNVKFDMSMENVLQKTQLSEDDVDTTLGEAYPRIIHSISISSLSDDIQEIFSFQNDQLVSVEYAITVPESEFQTVLQTLAHQAAELLEDLLVGENQILEGKTTRWEDEQKNSQILSFPDTDTSEERVIFLGLGNLAHKQIVKGILFLAVEIAYLLFMIEGGINNLYHLITLGGRAQEEVWNEAKGIYEYTGGDMTILFLLYGVATIFITVLFFMIWRVNMKSAYEVECRAKEGKHINTIKEDLEALVDKRLHWTLLTLPILGIVIFTILPLVFMICMAFTSYSKVGDHLTIFHWVGLKNFSTVLGMGNSIGKTFWSVLGWTLIWAVLATFLNYILGMILAIVINRKTTRIKGFWRFCFMLSAAIPQFVSLLLMRTMLKDNGLINNLLVQAGLISSPLPFLTNATWARATVVIINLWVGIPFTMMQVTGILQNIPGELYEAARVDGAGPVTIFFKITLPYMLFVTTPYLITTFTGNINNFNVIYLLTAGAPVPVGATAGKTDLLVTWLYKLTVDLQYFNVGAVVGILTFVILAVVSLITYRNTGSYKNEEGFQ